ncbi:MAG: hypothetical protein QM657_15005 [Lacrimispora sp.]|uniref:putative Ig domain-containing protein n=1 Tax=Lacrimispora sp. TaxID=2719234 RepID=UPI0039E4716E
MKKMWKKAGSLFLAACMVITILPMNATAEIETLDLGGYLSSGGIITAFEELDTDVAWQTVETGTTKDELEFPDALVVMVGESGNTVASGSEAEKPEHETTVDVSEWTADPIYDGDTEGDYIFTPALDLPEGLMIADNVNMPIITVTVTMPEMQTGSVAGKGGIMPYAEGYFGFEKPTNLKWDDTIPWVATWDAVDGAGAYAVQYAREHETSGYVEIVTGQEKDFRHLIYISGLGDKWKFSVRALRNESTDPRSGSDNNMSDWSEWSGELFDYSTMNRPGAFTLNTTSSNWADGIRLLNNPLTFNLTGDTTNNYDRLVRGNIILNIPTGRTFTQAAKGTFGFDEGFSLKITGGGTLNIGSTDKYGIGGGSNEYYGTVNLENINVTITNRGIRVSTLNIDDGATVTIDANSNRPLLVPTNAICTVKSGGKIDIIGDSHEGVEVDKGTLHIAGGTVTVGNSSGFRGIKMVSESTESPTVLKITDGGTLNGTPGGIIELCEGVKLEGVKGLFADRGNLLNANGEFIVGGSDITSSTTGLTAGLYYWTGDKFEKHGILISQQPSDKSLGMGQSGTLSITATATNSKNVSYKWYKYSIDDPGWSESISGATDSTLTIPNNLPEGEHRYYCELSAEGCDFVYSRDVTVIVGAVEPTITTAALPNGQMGTAYSQTLTAAGTGTMKWTIADGSLPGGLVLSESGIISGKPTAEGTFNFTVKAENGVAPDATKAFSIVIAAEPPKGNAPAITTTSLPGGQVGTVYNRDLKATGTGTLKWTIADGSLPSGLALTANGIISGTPAAKGTFTFTVKAENGIAPDAIKALSIVISAAPINGDDGNDGGNSSGNGGGSSGGNGGGGSRSAKGSSSASAATPETPGTWNQDQRGWKLAKPDGTNYVNEWAFVKNCWYRMGADGYMLQGWNTIDGKTYYLNPVSGEMETGWLFDNNSWYYLEQSGAMNTGWALVNGKWYYLNADGKMAANTVTPDGYKVGEDGSWLQ